MTSTQLKLSKNGRNGQPETRARRGTQAIRKSAVYCIQMRITLASI